MQCRSMSSEGSRHWKGGKIAGFEVRVLEMMSRAHHVGWHEGLCQTSSTNLVVGSARTALFVLDIFAIVVKWGVELHLRVSSVVAFDDDHGAALERTSILAQRAGLDYILYIAGFV